MTAKVWGRTALVLGAAALAVAAGSLLLPSFFDLRFGQLFAANTIGVLLAALLAFWIDRSMHAERHRQLAEAAEADRLERLRESLGALRKAVRHNDDLVRQVSGVLPGGRITYTTDPGAIDVLLPRVLDATGDLGLVREASDYRYRLEHLGRLLDTVLRLRFDPTSITASTVTSPRGVSVIEERRRSIESEAVQLGQKLQQVAGRLLERIDFVEEEDSWA